MKIGIIIRHSILDNREIVYAISTDYKKLKLKTIELNSKPSYKHPFEGYLFRYTFAYKNLKVKQ